MANYLFKKFFLLIVLSFLAQSVCAQNNRIQYNDQALFLSGTNIAWIHFAGDIGPGYTDLEGFEEIFLDVHANGGNALRLWLHTHGEHTPAFDDSGMVVGPGQDAISDLRDILDLAWGKEVGLILCLWSFDMMHITLDTDMKERNRKLLEDSTYMAAYIQNSLVPMVDSLKGHPGIISWEIFNEAEGMCHDVYRGGWSSTEHVSISDVQTVVNRCAGAIHRTDSTAQVTNGTWSFIAASDVGDNNTNYYTDERLLEAGGDSLGYLDFYTVHYYYWAGTERSPFHHDCAHWELDKPLVVAEFFPTPVFGIQAGDLFAELYNRGYAGALSWSWTDNSVEQWNDALKNMHYLWENHRQDVDVNGIAGDWPSVVIVEPEQDTEFAENDTITILAEAGDTDGYVVRVEFYANDSFLTEDMDLPYSYAWEGVATGSYMLYAIAEDNDNHRRISKKISIRVGEPEMARYEAEDAQMSGDISIHEDIEASNGLYVFMMNSGSIIWTVCDIPDSREYDIIFGYQIPPGFGPKTQYLNVNGNDEGEIVFENTQEGVWLEKRVTVNLDEGTNTIALDKYWGWMYFDYLAVRSATTGLEDSYLSGDVLPHTYKLNQNCPNPFNCVTKISYELPERSEVSLKIYDITGRPVKECVNTTQTSGRYEITFHAKNLASGMYFYTLEAGNFAVTRRMIFLK